jgi:HAD superfamily hydrolase (TIGR01549 family)
MKTLTSRKRIPEAVIFDIDGTLIDTFDLYCTVFNRGIGGYGLGPVSREFLARRLSAAFGLREMLHDVFPAGTDEATFDACRADIRRLFLQAEAGEVKLFPGIEELFRHLKERGIKIGIATGRVSTSDDEWKRFRRFGLDTFVDAIVTSKEIACRKPAGDVIVECARRLGVPVEDCIAIGDTESDVVATRDAGAIAVAVTTGQDDHDRLWKAGPATVCASVNDLIALLEGMGDGGNEVPAG